MSSYQVAQSCASKVQMLQLMNMTMGTTTVDDGKMSPFSRMQLFHLLSAFDTQWVVRGDSVSLREPGLAQVQWSFQSRFTSAAGLSNWLQRGRDGAGASEGDHHRKSHCKVRFSQCRGHGLVNRQ